MVIGENVTVTGDDHARAHAAASATFGHIKIRPSTAESAEEVLKTGRQLPLTTARLAAARVGPLRADLARDIHDRGNNLPQHRSERQAGCSALLRQNVLRRGVIFLSG